MPAGELALGAEAHLVKPGDLARLRTGGPDRARLLRGEVHYFAAVR